MDAENVLLSRFQCWFITWKSRENTSARELLDETIICAKSYFRLYFFCMAWNRLEYFIRKNRLILNWNGMWYIYTFFRWLKIKKIMWNFVYWRDLSILEKKNPSKMHFLLYTLYYTTTYRYRWMRNVPWEKKFTIYSR